MVSRETLLDRYAELLIGANTDTNLVSRRLSRNEVHELVHAHARTLDELGIEASDGLLDIGTGAGLPGIPLAIRHAEMHVVLSETRKRRLQALAMFRDRLDLKNVTLLPGRAETHLPDLAEAFDLVTAIGVMSAADTIGLAAPFLAPGGRAILSCPLEPSREEEGLWLLTASMRDCRAEVRRRELPGPRSALTLTRRWRP